MEETVYKVTLANGTEIENLRLNGNNFISEEEIDESIFENNCSPVIISSGEDEEGEIHQAMNLIHVTKWVMNIGLLLGIFPTPSLPLLKLVLILIILHLCVM